MMDVNNSLEIQKAMAVDRKPELNRIRVFDENEIVREIMTLYIGKSLDIL